MDELIQSIINEQFRFCEQTGWYHEDGMGLQGTAFPLVF